jgi:pimeloyl-ACP methyl ester carboxylesterase
MRKYKFTRDLYVYDRAEPWPDQAECEPLDIRAHDETWRDMMRLQSDGTYPAAFSAIESPVLMLHGAYDPHPGKMIYDSLRPFIRQLEYREWERCGHSPWLERSVGKRVLLHDEGVAFDKLVERVLLIIARSRRERLLVRPVAAVRV